MTPTHKALLCSVEGLEFVGLHWCLVLVEMREGILSAVMMRVIVCVDGLCFKTGYRIKLFDCCRTQPCESTEHCPLDLCDLCVLHGVHQGVLSFCSMILKLLCCVFLTERCD